MTALAFAMLDRHVIDGSGENPATSDPAGALTFARLLERSAALAGGLAALGVDAGHPVGVGLPAGNSRVIAVCALIRLGAVPADEAEVRIDLVDGEERIDIRGESVELSLVERAGRSDPAPAVAADPDGYAEVIGRALGGTLGDIVEPLLTGSPVI